MPKRVLVIDAIATHRIRFAALLENARYKVDTIMAPQALKKPARDYDIVLIGLPDEGPARLITAVNQVLDRPKAPILCLDRKGSPLRRLLAMRAGARDVLPSKSPDDLVLALVRRLIRQGEAERETERRRITATSFGFSEAVAAFTAKARIVCLGDLGQMPERLSALLHHDVVNLPDASALEDAMPSAGFDAILVHTGQDAIALREVLTELQDNTHLSPVPILALYPENQADIATDALALGASEVAPETAGLEEFELRIAQMLAQKAQADALRWSDEQSYRLAATDPLTGLYNRRYAEAYLATLPVGIHDSRTEFCMLLLDLDHFKKVNDTYGHVAGDIALREVATCIQANLRACDLVARYGGEEFLVILPETSCATATLLAERLRRAVAAHTVPIPKVGDIALSASIGVAAGALDQPMVQKRTGTFDLPVRFGNGPFEEVFTAADAALYRAKSLGRNRVEVSVASDL
ncbi:MAG: diguanylate cyclase [Pseudomonadota bacterium]